MKKKDGFYMRTTSAFTKRLAEAAETTGVPKAVLIERCFMSRIDDEVADLLKDQLKEQTSKQKEIVALKAKLESLLKKK